MSVSPRGLCLSRSPLCPPHLAQQGPVRAQQTLTEQVIQGGWWKSPASSVRCSVTPSVSKSLVLMGVHTTRPSLKPKCFKRDRPGPPLCLEKAGLKSSLSLPLSPVLFFPSRNCISNIELTLPNWAITSSVSSPLKETRYPLAVTRLTPTPTPQQQLIYFLSVPLSVLDISHKWNHTICGLLCLASCT